MGQLFKRARPAVVTGLVVAAVSGVAVASALAASSTHTTAQATSPAGAAVTPSCPVSQAGPTCIWTSDPPYDPTNLEGQGLDQSDFYDLASYWAAEKRPDVEQNAIQPYGYSQSTVVWWNWALDAAQAGYAVTHTPTAGAIAVWPANTLDAGDEGQLGYVEQVNPDGSIVVSEMGVEDDSGAYDDGETEWFDASDAASLSFIPVKSTTATTTTSTGSDTTIMSVSPTTTTTVTGTSTTPPPTRRSPRLSVTIGGAGAHLTVTAHAVKGATGTVTVTAVAGHTHAKVTHRGARFRVTVTRDGLWTITVHIAGTGHYASQTVVRRVKVVSVT